MCFALKPQLIDLSQRKTYLSGVFFVNDAAISAGLVSTILSKVVVFFIKVKKFVKKHNVFIAELVFLPVLVLHLAVLVLVSRMLPAASEARSFMIWAALLSTLAPAFDALENLVSFVMRAEPLSFEPALALHYSTLAAGKFAMFAFAYVAVFVGVLWALFSRLPLVRRRESAA